MNYYSSKIGTYIQKIKRKPLLVTIAMLSSIVIGVAAFADAFEQIYSRIHISFQMNSGDLRGYWVIGGTEKTWETYIKFETLGDKIIGNTTVFYNAHSVKARRVPVTVAIHDVNLQGKVITFTTKRSWTVWRSDHRKDRLAGKFIRRAHIWNYVGKIDDDRISFHVKSVEDNYFDDVIAKKIDIDSAKSRIKTMYEAKYGEKIGRVP